MTQRSVQQVEALFEIYLVVSALPSDEQTAYLSNHVLDEGDRELIQTLLESSSTIRGWGAQPAPDSNEAPLLPSGTLIGAYEIEHLIGSGGQGKIYLASHAREKVERKVAIKLPRHLAIDSLVGVRREAQALAKLDHPAIARFLSVDRTGDGQIFLVTEFVDGRPIDQALQEAASVSVVAMFEELCLALNHAHQRGIAHLDIKPSNVLVDNSGQVKIVDFGLGLMYSDDAPSGPAYGFSRPYAAPEQMSGEASAASDIYSLGALLYQVLSRTPAKVLPERIAAMRSGGDGSGSDAGLGAELRAILRRACAELPADRYPSIALFGADLAAIRSKRPVGAVPWTWRYALRCLARRRPWATAATVTAVCLLATSTVALSVQHVRLVRAEETARKEAVRARVGLDLVVSAMESADPEVAPKVTDSDRALVDRMRRAANTSGDPDVRTATNLVVARIAYSLGDLPTADSLLAEVLGDAQSTGSAQLLAQALEMQASMQVERAEFDKADATLARLRALPGGYGQSAAALYAEGRRWVRGGDLTKAEAVLRAALLAVNDDALSIRIVNALGTVLNDRGQFSEALVLFEAQRPLVAKVYGENSVSAGVSAHNRAVSNYGLAKPAAAIEDIREAESDFSSQLGQNNLRFAEALVLEATILLTDDSTRAADCLQKALAIFRANYGPDHPKVAYTLYTLGQLHLADDDASTALEEFEQGIGIARKSLNEHHPLVAMLTSSLGEAHLALGQAGTAVPLLEQALATFQQVNDKPDATKAIVEADLSHAYREVGRVDESDKASRYAMDVAKATLPADSLELAQYGMERAASLAAVGHIDEAREQFSAARTIFDARAATPAARKARPKLDQIGLFIENKAGSRHST